MKIVLLSLGIALVTLSARSARAHEHIEPYKNQADLTEKTYVLETLLSQTYGADNPFRQLAHIARITLGAAEEITQKANKTQKQSLLELAGELAHNAGHLDAAISAAIAAHTAGAYKEDALKALIMQCNVSASLIMNETLPHLKKGSRNRIRREKKRFIMADPSIIGSIGKWVLASAAGLWIVYVIKDAAQKAHAYWVRDNTELIRETQLTQGKVQQKLLDFHHAAMNTTSCDANAPLLSPTTQPKRGILKKAWDTVTFKRPRETMALTRGITDDCEILKRSHPFARGDIERWKEALKATTSFDPTAN